MRAAPEKVFCVTEVWLEDPGAPSALRAPPPDPPSAPFRVPVPKPPPFAVNPFDPTTIWVAEPLDPLTPTFAVPDAVAPAPPEPTRIVAV